MNPKDINKKFVAFFVLTIFFFAALFYFVSASWRNREAIQAKQSATDELINGI